MNCQVSDGRRRWLRTSIAGRYRASARQVFFGESEVPQRPVEGRHERVRMGQVFLATFWDFLSNRRPAASAVISAARHRSAGRDRMLPSRPPSKRRAAAISTAIVSQSFYAGCNRDGSSVSRKRSREPKTSVPRRVVDSTGSLGVCRIGRTEEAKECWSGLQSDYGLHESMLSQIVGLGYPLPQT